MFAVSRTCRQSHAEKKGQIAGPAKGWILSLEFRAHAGHFRFSAAGIFGALVAELPAAFLVSLHESIARDWGNRFTAALQHSHFFSIFQGILKNISRGDAATPSGVREPDR